MARDRRLYPLQRIQRLQERQRLARADVERARPAIASLYDLYSTPDAPLTTFDQYARHAFGAMGEPGNAVVFACVVRRMKVFSEAAFKWRSFATKRLFGSAELAVLDAPWPGGSAGSLLARAELDVSLAGNAFVRSTGDGLERLRPDWVTIVSQIVEDALGEQVRRLVGYYYDPVGDVDRDPAYYLADEVAHWAPIPDPLAHWRGMSWMTPLVREINSDVRMADFREAFFKNAATANVIITYKDKVVPERLAKIRQAMAARHVGAENAFGTLLLDEGADVTIAGANMEGAAFDALQAAGETRICMAAGVPPIVAGARQGLQASAIGEYAQALRAFADLEMRPNWRSLCGALQTVCPPPPGAQLWFDTTDVSALRQGEKDAADTNAQQASTLNTLIMAGFDPASAVAAVTSGDMSLLVHTGMTSVQMRPATAPKAQAVQDLIDMIAKGVSGVGPVLTADELRKLLNGAGADLAANYIPVMPKVNGKPPSLAGLGG